MNVIMGTSAGFFSNFRGTVGALSILKGPDDEERIKCHVDWRNTIYGDWTNFFKKIDSYKDDVSIRTHKQNPLGREYQTRLTMNQTISRYVTVQEEILGEVSEIESDFGEKTLGVHIRRTDKHNCTKTGEPITGRPIDLDLYEKHMREEMENHDKIFLATDDVDTVEHMKGVFGDDIVLKEDCMRGSGDMSVHHHMGGDGTIKGKEVLIDCLLLSKCNHLIKGISNVALCAMFFNLDLTNTNLNSIYNNDTRENFVDAN